jgi:anti-sigma-K factor RskA
MASSHKYSWSFDRNSTPASATSAHSPTASPARSASPASSPEAPPRPAHTLSVKEYHSEHQRFYRQGDMDPTTDKVSRDAERRPRLARDDLFADHEEQVSYGSDTSTTTPPRSPEPDAPRTPSPFPEHGATQELTALRASSGLESGVIINALDEVQERQLEGGEVQRSQRLEARPLVSSHRDYHFRALDPTEVVREAMNQRSLRTWISGPAATAASALEARAALRERYLTPQETTPAVYGARLADQARRASVPQMRTYPVVLLAGETSQEDDALIRNWVERARQLPSLDALRASFSEVGVRLERRLLFEYAKVKTKCQAPSSSTRPPGPVPHAPPSYGSLHRGGSTAVTAPDQRLSSATDPVAPRPITRSRARGALSISVIKSVHDVGAVLPEGYLKIP